MHSGSLLQTDPLFLQELIHHKATIDASGSDDWTPLHLAVHGGFVDVVEVNTESTLTILGSQCVISAAH